MRRDWLWDRKISISKAEKVLKNPDHKDFIMLSSLLLARKNTPREIFKEYLTPIVFCNNWPKIKQNMRKDKWSSQRIIFWQAIYEKLIEKYRKKGIKFREKKQAVANELCRKVGLKIRNIRKEQALSQKELAEKMSVSQQLISRIESGRENVSVDTLKRIAKVFNKQLIINLQ